ncbi:MAG UNVERIFIED_CONTAM: DUF1552 domain-containing protein [Planctomycetaceae bacterium]|jgi:hypothetical protein
MARMILPRRTLLRGLGAAISLPMLESMAPAYAAVTTAAPVRMACLFFANGAIMDKWRPSGDGADFALSPTLQPLENVKNHLLVLEGLTQHHARANGDGPGDHARNASAYLTGAQPRKTSGADISVGQSIDQAVAEKIGSQTRLPSIELGIDRGRNAGSCDSGYSCSYSSNISWKTATTPCSKESNPRAAFERLFGSPEEAADRERRLRDRRSILDFVGGDLKRIQPSLSGADRQKLDEYFTSLRDVEQRVARADQGPREVPELKLPDGVPAELKEHIRLMFDILALAFQTDSTRVATFMLADAGSNRTYPDVDVRDGHHELSHHQNDQGKMEKISRIDRYLVEQFAGFLTRLSSISEGGSTLLDNSMILYGSAISDGNRHNHDDLPILLAGGGGGSIKSGRYIKYAKETPLNNLFISMAQRMGAQLDSLGDSHGPLENLT